MAPRDDDHARTERAPWRALPAALCGADTARAMDLRALIKLVPSIARQPLEQLLTRLETLERQVADLQAAQGTLSIDLHAAHKEHRP